MRFLGFGKKKSNKKNASNALETLSNMPSSATAPSLVPDVSKSVETNSISKPTPSKEIPVLNSDSLNNSSLNPNVSSTDNLVEDKTIPTPDKTLNLPETLEDSSFDDLPNFSEDDFSAPLKPSLISKEPSVSKKEIKKEVSINQPNLLTPTKKEYNQKKPSFASSYADSNGVYVSRIAYISLLNSLKESSKKVSSLSTRQKQLVNFDNSLKKIFDKESSNFEKLRKDILAIMPFVSKK